MFHNVEETDQEIQIGKKVLRNFQKYVQQQKRDILKKDTGNQCGNNNTKIYAKRFL